jgi:hypothetical protein
MKRQYLLIAGCILGAVSVGLNIQLYRQRHEPAASGEPVRQENTVKPSPSPVSADSAPVRELNPLPSFPQVKFDFSDTAFADGSWKLTDPASTVDFDKPFNWEDLNPAQPKEDPDNPFGVGDPPKKPPVIKESYAGAPAKIDGGTGKTVEPPPASPAK